MDPILFAKWTLLLLETAENNSQSIEKISYLLQKCSFPEHKEISVLLLTFILDGKIKLKRVKRWEDDMQDSVELEESSRLPVSVFSHVQRIWEEKNETTYFLFCRSYFSYGTGKVTNVIAKTNSFTKKEMVFFIIQWNFQNTIYNQKILLF